MKWRIDSQTISLTQLSKTFLATFKNNISFREFSNHIPSWGGEIKTFSEDFENINKYQDFKEYNNLKIVNTCSIDYFLFSFLVSNIIITWN
jgi:hypothetical protein